MYLQEVHGNPCFSRKIAVTQEVKNSYTSSQRNTIHIAGQKNTETVM